MTNPSIASDLIERLRGYVTDGDQYGSRAKHPTTIAVRIDIEKAAEALSQLTREVDAYAEALTPSGETKATYHGEFHFTLTRIGEAGDEYSERVYVPWDATKEIMAAIRKRALSRSSGRVSDATE